MNALSSSQHNKGRLGFAFDNDNVREVPIYNSEKYNDGYPWWLLVNADNQKSPSMALDFCEKAIVVNLDLREWKKQFRAKKFISPPPSCLEVVYLLYAKIFN